MIPYLHLGPLEIPTFGLMVALALITSAYVLQADFDRRGLNADAFTMITVAGLAGIFGAKLYHLLEPENRALFFDHPLALIFSRFGFAWFGGFLGGFGAMLLMGWRAKLRMWEFLDACSPAASFGYAIGRIGCFLSGDGDYGKPTSLPWGMSFPNGVVPTTQRVHPTPLYEFAAWCAIGWLLWMLGAPALKKQRPLGEIFCYYLILTGVARFLVEIIRINPVWFWGMSNAQVASVFSILVGAVLLAALKQMRAS
ncbi:MAG TPA: prolipoprotein diacylglyceryl transferase [Candidatus Eisenbacteria bacterium]|nr:prolipoprotein diacylglyceryl transferase [Candidatus Eisenbacteria bacterium]